MIRVIILGSNASTCELYRSIIDEEPGFRCKHVYQSCRRLQSEIPHVLPDVVLYNTAMLHESASSICLHEIRKMRYDLPILIVTAHEDDDALFVALRAGATGYLYEGFAVDELLVSIREAFAHKGIMSPGIAKRMLQSLDNASRHILTKPQLRILELLSNGDTIKEIATQLSISRNAVGKHIYQSYSRLSKATGHHMIQGHPKHESYQTPSESSM